MSNTKKHQKWCKKTLDVIVFTNNWDLSEALKRMLAEHYRRNVSKHVAHDLSLNLYTVRNWYNKGTGLKAYDLLKLLENYDFIRDFLGFRKIIPNNRITGKKNRDICRLLTLQKHFDRDIILDPAFAYHFRFKEFVRRMDDCVNGLSKGDSMEKILEEMREKSDRILRRDFLVRGYGTPERVKRNRVEKTERNNRIKR